LKNYFVHLSNTFSKSERICKKKTIEELFKNSSSVFQYPLKVAFLPANPQAQSTADLPEILFIVGKKKLKKAVDRNLVKRRLREAYRCQKPDLSQIVDPQKKIQHLSVIYVADQVLPLKIIKKQLYACLARIYS